MGETPARCGKGGRGAHSGRALVALAAVLALSGCSFLRALDFGGDDKKPWEFRFGWEHGVSQAASGTKPGQVDSSGVYQPATPEVAAELGFPDVNAGLAGEVYPRTAVTPTLQLTAVEFKVPYARWFDVEVGAGANLALVYVGKRLVTLPKITVGPWFGRDFNQNRWAAGAAFTLIKF